MRPNRLTLAPLLLLAATACSSPLDSDGMPRRTGPADLSELPAAMLQHGGHVVLTLTAMPTTEAMQTLMESGLSVGGPQRPGQVATIPIVVPSRQPVIDGSLSPNGIARVAALVFVVKIAPWNPGPVENCCIRPPVVP